MPLFPYQRAGVRFLEASGGRALLADEMGLGKTVQVLAWLHHRKSLRPAIVVCPTSLRLHWQQEIDTWTGERAYLPSSTKSDGVGYHRQPFVVIHYEILVYWLDWLRALPPNVIVIDEAQAIKSSKARRTKAVRQLARGVAHVIGLTGTPIVNRPIEAFNILQLIDRKRVPNWHHYTQRYCAPKYNGFGWDYRGASNTQELHALLSGTIMLRRRKEDVLPDLPDKIRSFIPLPLSNAGEYREAERDFIGYLSDVDPEAVPPAKRARALTRINRLRLLAAHGKLEAAIDWIVNVAGDDKLVVFANHRHILQSVYDWYYDWKSGDTAAVLVDGTVTERGRAEAVNRFQSDDGCKLFIGQLRVAGTGLTLTAASRVAFLELPWTPGDLSQAEDRVHRIGQSHPVNIYYLLAAGTIDEYIAHLIDRKRVVLNAVLDGAKDPGSSIFTELLTHYKKRRD